MKRIYRDSSSKYICSACKKEEHKKCANLSKVLRGICHCQDPNCLEAVEDFNFKLKEEKHGSKS